MSRFRHAAILRTLIAGVVCFCWLTPIVLAQAGCSPQKLSPSQLRGDAVESNWLHYRNSENGLSFRYPPSIRVEERNPRPFHLDVTPEVVVDLKGDEPNNPNITVMRFICYRGRRTSKDATGAARELLKTHPREDASGRVDDGSIGAIRVAGHEAIVSCSCGRAACGYSIHVLQPYSCQILPMVGGDGFRDNLPPPHDGMFPLLSIVRTVHFQSKAK